MLSLVAPSYGPVLSRLLLNLNVGLSGNRYPLMVEIALAAAGSSKESTKSGLIFTAPSDFAGQNNCTHIELDGQCLPKTPWVNTTVVRYTPSQKRYRVTQDGGTFYYTHVVVPGSTLSVSLSAPDVSPQNITSVNVWGEWKGNLFKVACSVNYYGPTSGGEPYYVRLYHLTFKLDATGALGATSPSSAIDLGNKNDHAWSGVEAWNYIEQSGRWTVPSTSVQPSYSCLGQFDDLVSQSRFLVGMLDKSVIYDSRFQPTNGWGELAYQTYSKVQTFSGNGIAYVKDLKNMRQMVDSLGDILRLAGTVGRWTKAIADLFLAWHYGARLMASDTKDLLKSISNYSRTFQPSFRHYASSTREFSDNTKMEFHYEAFIPPYDTALGALYGILRDFDLLPTMENFWDLVPFSFVVDWFVNAGEVLDRLDMCSLYSTLNISYVCYSVKSIAPFVLPDGMEGNVECRTYRRWFRRNPEPPALNPTSSPDPLRHVVEGSSLIVSKIG